MKKRLLIIVGALVFLGAGNYAYWYYSRDVIDVSVGGNAQILQPARAPHKSEITDKGNGTFILTGTITDVFDDRPVDGDSGVIVDDHYKVSIYGSGECQDCRTTPGYTDNYHIDDTVEIFASGTLREPPSYSYLSIIGDEYYLRVK